MAFVSRETTTSPLPYRFRELKASLTLATYFQNRETRHTKEKTYRDRVTNTFGRDFAAQVSSLLGREVRTIVESGASFGVTTIELASLFPDARVLGMDINRAVLAKEEATSLSYYAHAYGISKEALHSRIAWLHTDSYLPPLAPQSVDLLMFMNNLFFAVRHNRLTHRELSLIAEHQLLTLKPGGILAISGDKTFALFQVPRHSEEQIRRVGVHLDVKATGLSSNKSTLAHLTTTILRLNGQREWFPGQLWPLHHLDQSTLAAE